MMYSPRWHNDAAAVEEESALQSVEQGVVELMQGLVLESEGVAELLAGLATAAASRLSTPECEVFCGVTFLRPPRMGTVAFSDDRALVMDEFQYAFDDGPCLRAAREDTVVVVEDFATESRFPEYTQAVREHGLRSALGVPIVLEGSANAGLNLYAREPRAFPAPVIDAASEIAGHASASLRLALRMAVLRETRDDLAAAMESRTTIDLAIGVIMGQSRINQQEAVAMLKRAASARNIKLRDLAHSMITTLGEGIPPHTHFDR